MTRITNEERFWAQVNKTATCWLWTEATNHDGYGLFYCYHRNILAHRFAYELLVSSVPEGLELDHLCHNPACINPVHLEPVTHLENVRRGHGGQNMARKTRCPQGHPYDLFNTRINNAGSRECRECTFIRHRNYSRVRNNATRIRKWAPRPRRRSQNWFPPKPLNIRVLPAT